MNVVIICEECSEDRPDTDPVYMRTEGPLAFNPDDKSQAQLYVCPACNHSITIILMPILS